MMDIKPTDKTMTILNEIAKLKNMNVMQVSEKILEIYSTQYLKMVQDAKRAATNAENRYDV